MANNNETSQKGALKKSMSDRHSYVASFHRHAPAGARLNLEYASATLRNDRDVVLTAVQQNGRSLQYASETLRNDRDVVLAAQEQNGVVLYFASETLRNDRDVVLAAVEQNAYALQFASETLRNDREVVLAAVEQNPYALQFASERLRNDRGVVLAAVEQNAYALQFASERLRNDSGVVLSAVEQNGRAIGFVSQELRNDRDVVLAAVQQNGLGLQFAPETLRNDRDVVLAAVEQNGYSLEYASSDLKADRAVVLAAMRKTPKVFLLAITTRGDYDEQSLLFRDRSLWVEWCRSEPSECTERTPPMDPRLWSEILVVAKSRLATRDSERQLVCDITDLAFEPLLPALVAGGESPTVTVHTVYCFNGQQEVWLGLSPETNVTQFADLVLRRKFPTTPSSQQLGLLLSSPPAPLIYLRLLFKNAPLSVWTGDELLTSLLNPIRVVQGTSSEQQREHAPAESLSASPPRCSSSVPDQQ